MKIDEIISKDRYDFSAMMECEHCGHVGKISNGYDDHFYHSRVIPAMRCKECGKNRAGDTEHTDSEVSPCSV